MTVQSSGGATTGGGTISNSQQWAAAIEQAGGYPQTQSNTQFLEAWAQAEGGQWENSAAYNPINTTQQTAGSTGSINSVGVQSYNSWDSGIAATLQTLNNGYYNNITSALASGNATQQAQAGNLNSDLGTWGTGSGFISNGVLASPSILGGGTGGGAWSPAGVSAAGGIGNSTGTGTAGTGTTPTSSSSGSPTQGPAGLLGNCSQYRNSSAASSNCLVGGGGGLLGISAPCVLNACQAKALVSGGLVLAGGLLMLVGTALLFADKGGILGKAADAAGAVYLVKGISSSVKSHAPKSGGLSDSAQYKASTQSRAKTGGGPARPVSHSADEGEF